MEQSEENRDQWGSRFGFILAAIGSAVGLGNIWRFPYMTYENGGGAFLIPYFFALLTAGIPLLILEMGLGHKMRGSAPLSFRKIKEKYETLGWWSVLITFVVTVYYSVIVAWAINFMSYSFNQVWGATPNKFFFKEYLQMTSFWNIGGIRFNILAGLALVWGLNGFILYNGIKEGIEKAAKIFMPILALLVVLITIRGVTLPGAINGLNHFLKPDFSVLLNPNVWVSAYGQVFFTLSLGFGIMIAYASYLPKKEDVVNNAFITAFANSGFSFLAGLGIFGVLGYMAQAKGIPFKEVATDGIGLAFIAFPKAINMLPGMQGFFGFLFFLCLTIAGISSTMSLVESFSSSVIDKFQIKRKQAIALVCGLGFLASTIFATGMGLVVLDVVDHFILNYGLVIVGLIESIILGYFWDLSEIKDHVNQVSDFKVGNWWIIAIKYVTAIILGVMSVMKLKNELASLYNGYPLSAIITLGWGTVFGLVILAYVTKNISWNQEIKVDVLKEEM
ncbi:SNF family Na+-dependent transporter [Halobacteroides halobius DSM 5150]|uniref:Transporter n=1 Tax=Halobacteroides halobius (strain ATCC 35273 / DSM 5150 / MD-1) TaxID=748449 RepID=L0K5I6_HALHC|nr:sodium-dependent transporter [Halobacteroides halobius]AGB40547.1 SNF family Na+-dependent transporter [Halobacteroides halobius DSM 5150]